MSVIRAALRSAVIVCAVAVGAPALATLLSTPAAALCFGIGCGGGFHGGLVSSLFARRQTMPSIAAPATQGLTRLQSNQHVSSVTAIRSTLASSKVPSSKVPSSKVTSPKVTSPTLSSSKIPSSKNSHKDELLTRRPPPTEFNAGGPSTNAVASPGGLGQGVSGGNSTFSGGLTQGGGNGSSGLDAVTPASSGGGSGQVTSASTTAGNSSGPSRSLTGAGASNRTSTSGSGATSTATTSNTRTAPNLTAVTVCMTPAGNCPMERDVGTACQCRDPQGNLYDGIVK